MNAESLPTYRVIGSHRSWCRGCGRGGGGGGSGGGGCIRWRAQTCAWFRRRRRLCLSRLPRLGRHRCVDKQNETKKKTKQSKAVMGATTAHNTLHHNNWQQGATTHPPQQLATRCNNPPTTTTCGDPQHPPTNNVQRPRRDSTQRHVRDEESDDSSEADATTALRFRPADAVFFFLDLGLDGADDADPLATNSLPSLADALASAAAALAAGGLSAPSLNSHPSSWMVASAAEIAPPGACTFVSRMCVCECDCV